MQKGQEKNKIKVGILRGGTGRHYESSLRKGGDLISHISKNLSDKYKTVDILVDKKGKWHINGIPVNPADLAHKVDVIWNTVRANVSSTLQNFSIPHISNSIFSSTLENSREMLEEHIKDIGIQMPRSIVLPLYQKDFDGPRERYAIKKAKEIFEKFGSPWIVKSFTDDSDMGIHLAKTFGELAEAIEDGVAHAKSILVEEFIGGKVASMHSVPSFRGQDIYVFPPGNAFGNFTSAEKEKLISLAKDLHNHIGAKHYLKSDFVLNPRGKLYLLNIESTPDLKPDSHFSQICESVGAKMHHIIEHILQRALGEKE
jgi:D-alanine-D-alanine ligase